MSEMTGPHPGDLPGVFGEAGEGGQVDDDVDYCPVPPLGQILAVEQVEEDVGSDLVHGPGITNGFELSGVPVDLFHDRSGLSGWKMGSVQVVGPIRIRFRSQLPFLQPVLIPFPGCVGVDGDGETSDPGRQLTGGLARRLVQHLVDHPVTDLRVEVEGVTGDHPGLGQVDHTGL